jgi:mono/diheme cytochrome c family protein
MRTVQSVSFLASTLALGLALTSFACGGTDHTANAPTGPVDADAGVAAPVPTSPAAAASLPRTWSDSMSKEQQVAFMSQNVIGPLGKTFKEHDGARYADFSCKTCHGPNRQNPHAFLPHLKLEGENLTAFKTDPEVAKFMHEKVVPAMATAMGMPEYDMKTHQGFGCAGCHSIDK